MVSFTERIKNKFQSTPPRFWAVLVSSTILVFTVLVLAMTINVVTVTDSDGARKLLVTSANNPHAILNMADIETGEYDDIFYTDYAGPVSALYVQRAFPVEISADGVVQTAYISAGTTKNALEQLGVELSETDYCVPSLNTPLDEDTSVTVHRVEYRDTTNEVEVPPETTYQLSPLVKGNRTYVLQQGTPGLNQVTFRERVVDGELESAQVVQVEQLVLPTETVLLRSGNVPVSELEGPPVVNNAPTTYSRVIPGAVCAGYSAPKGRGASGLGLYAGTVAVNPNVIPYGSKLYITSADGSFVYGYAIATDTGGSLMEGIIDIDLFYDTYLESVLNGKKVLNVYVL